MMSNSSIYLKGSKLAYENAKRLFTSAEHLASVGEFPVANSLLVLSAEEAIKSLSILNHYLLPGEEQLDLKLMFEDHKYKINTVRSLIVFGRMSRMMMDLYYLPVYNALRDDAGDISEIKSKSFDTLMNWLRNEAKGKNTDLSIENKWWISAKAEKESGLYVGFNDKNSKWQSPSIITQKRYLKSKRYVEPFLLEVESIVNVDFESKEFTSLRDLIVLSIKTLRTSADETIPK